MDLAGDAHRVDTGEAPLAEAESLRVAFSACLKHSLCAYERQCVGTDLLAYLCHIVLVGDKFVPCRSVDSEVAWELNRWRCNAEVHFLGPGPAQYLHQTAAGGSAHYGVVDDHNPFPVHNRADSIKLYKHHVLPFTLGRGDECPSDISVLDKTAGIRDSGSLCITLGCAQAAVRHADNYICRHTALLGKACTHPLPCHIDRDSVHYAVWTCKVYILKYTGMLRCLLAELVGCNTFLVYHYNLARLDIPDKVAVQGVKCAAFACKHPAAVHLAKAQRADSVGVPGSDDAVIGHDDQGEGTFYHLDSIDKSSLQSFLV